ncbi:putative homogentisate 1,2-dioxygenase [Eremomyces bilateralis CBS 781.70]|uniref:homogentisate 1,2-dioxygenase n=1 Tax=Eremomyces bilateralis CBS 781.70 TaxID=1392243 RepID=A0A6G1FVY7_9PEZI|nr:putative homogentisate 1,2-dioxygenase [Eremomyces bilateralis CBS 781.70]KAF1809997.1 putative homogentisate 1,2-dioxygenase [Eremomyces bilateralis CBS 781.70]
MGDASILTPSVPKTFGASAAGSRTTPPKENDPYRYQLGFGNYFSSEAVPDALPEPGRNVPQRCPYDLYSEQLNGTPFASYRDTLQHVWMYRIRPAVAHARPRPMPASPDLTCFSPQNPNVQFTPLTYEWGPLEYPEEEDQVTFIHGLKTIGGWGDPTLKEGLAMHLYSCNASMEKKAFCNNDGDFLILPQVGRLEIQTELGRLMVRPGELCVIQAGLRWKVSLPDGPSRGYVHEVFGSHFELPDLGVIGSNGLAHPRDFEYPVASFDMDQSKWEITYKLAGQLFAYKQNHTPFDVVAWHGSYVPFKYAMEKFVPLACAMKEQCDPTIYTVLIAKSKTPKVALSEFAVYTAKHITALDTYRPPYYHRNMSTEMLGMIYGEYHGSVRDVQEGCLSCENSYMPHGDAYGAWKEATTKQLEHEVAGKDALSFMFHLNNHFSLTKFALERNPTIKQIPGYEGEFWDNLQGHFMDHLDEVNTKLAAMGLPALGQGSA